MKSVTKITAISALLLVSGIASAQTINTNVQATSNTRVADSAMIKSDTNAQVQVTSDVMERGEMMIKEGEEVMIKTANTLESNIDAGVEATTELFENSQVEVGVEAQSGVSTNSESTNTETGVSVNLTTKDLMTNSDLVITSSSEVTTESDLRAYAQTQAKSDTRIKAVTTNDSRVEMTYQVPVKLFGFIEMNMNQKATVTMASDNTTNVRVTKAWWGLFATSDDTSEIRSSVEAKISSMSTNTTLDARAQADVLDAIRASFRARD